jgi:hypothetical protein
LPQPNLRSFSIPVKEAISLMQRVGDRISFTSEGRLVSFSQTQIELGILYDAIGKHLRAINKGLVPPKGNNGLVASEEPDYDFKSKILGKGGDRRFHAKIIRSYAVGERAIEGAAK